MNEHSLIYMTNLYEEAMDLNTKLQEEIENIKNTNEEHRVLNGKLREELEFEKTTNKELISTGADLENKLYEEQDKNKRLNNIINKLEKYLIDEIEDYDKNINSRYVTGITKEQYEGEKTCFEDTLGKLQELKHKKVYGSVDSEILYYGELGSDKE